MRRLLVEHPDYKRGFLGFFELLETTLQKSSAEEVNRIAHNWIREFSSNRDEAELFLDLLSHESHVKGEVVSGSALLSAEYFDEAGDFIRGFWLRLKRGERGVIPEKPEVTHLFPEGVVEARIEEIPLAQLLLARDKIHKRDVRNKKSAKIEEYQETLRTLEGDASGYDQETASAVSGQNPTTMMRESVQNGRDAARELTEPEEREQGRIEIRIFVIRHSDHYELVTEVQDNGIGMDETIILNDLLPLDSFRPISVK
jgi:signal transduction histidine kinase